MFLSLGTIRWGGDRNKRFLLSPESFASFVPMVCAIYTSTISEVL